MSVFVLALAIVLPSWVLGVTWVRANSGETDSCTDLCSSRGLGLCDEQELKLGAVDASSCANTITLLGASGSGLSCSASCHSSALSIIPAVNEFYGSFRFCWGSTHATTCSRAAWAGFERICACSGGSGGGSGGPPTTTTSTTTTTTTTTIDGGSVGGDPVTYYGGWRAEFNLPLQQLVLMLATTEIKVWAMTFEGWTQQDQWIDRVVCTTHNDKPIVDIRVKKTLDTFRRNATPPYAFDTLDVHIVGHQLRGFPPADGYWKVGSTTTTFARPVLDAGGYPRRECVVMAGLSAKLVICSSSAREYYGSGFGANKYSHLDLEVFDMDHARFTFSGVLPELWGIVPISQSTEAMIKERTRVSNEQGNESASIDTSSTQSRSYSSAPSHFDSIGSLQV